MLTHNTYFDAKVQSVAFESHGRKASVGVIAPGSYHFGTDAPERMNIVSGKCTVNIDGSEETKSYSAGALFEVGEKSGFTITCTDPVAYHCEYL